MDAGLEVDGRNEMPILYQRQGQNHKYYNEEDRHDQSPHKPYSTEPPTKSKRSCGLRPATFILSIALAVFVVLAVVAAGVAGSFALERGHTRYVSPIEHLERAKD